MLLLYIRLSSLCITLFSIHRQSESFRSFLVEIYKCDRLAVITCLYMYVCAYIKRMRTHSHTYVSCIRFPCNCLCGFYGEKTKHHKSLSLSLSIFCTLFLFLLLRFLLFFSLERSRDYGIPSTRPFSFAVEEAPPPSPSPFRHAAKKGYFKQQQR